MGLAMWLAAGGAAVATARLIRAGRPGRWLGELALGLIAAVLFGLAATALDFGGWKEPDWRAGLFSLFGAAAVLGLARLPRMRR